MIKVIIIISFIISTLSIKAQVKQPYTIYNAKGKKVSYNKMMNKLTPSDIILFGELHNNAIVHWLQLEVTKELQQIREMTLGAEMIETDNQEALTLYLEGKINQKKFDSTARLWNNYKTDYKPLVDFAKDKKLKFVATNIPRRYASMVAKGGFKRLDTLPNTDKMWMPNLPIEYDSTLPQYLKIIEMMGGHNGANMPKAQAIKDATMANSIIKNYESNKLFLHYNGAFHSEYYEGILWYLKRKLPNLNYVTISTVTQSNINKLDKEHIGKADFIICVDEDMTNTY